MFNCNPFIPADFNIKLKQIEAYLNKSIFSTGVIGEINNKYLGVIRGFTWIMKLSAIPMESIFRTLVIITLTRAKAGISFVIIGRYIVFFAPNFGP